MKRKFELGSIIPVLRYLENYISRTLWGVPHSVKSYIGQTMWFYVTSKRQLPNPAMYNIH